jgi:hypothetical protein
MGDKFLVGFCFKLPEIWEPAMKCPDVYLNEIVQKSPIQTTQHGFKTEFSEGLLLLDLGQGRCCTCAEYVLFVSYVLCAICSLCHMLFPIVDFILPVITSGILAIFRFKLSEFQQTHD